MQAHVQRAASSLSAWAGPPFLLSRRLADSAPSRLPSPLLRYSSPPSSSTSSPGFRPSGRTASPSSSRSRASLSWSAPRSSGARRGSAAAYRSSGATYWRASAVAGPIQTTTAPRSGARAWKLTFSSRPQPTSSSSPSRQPTSPARPKSPSLRAPSSSRTASASASTSRSVPRRPSPPRPSQARPADSRFPLARSIIGPYTVFIDEKSVKYRSTWIALYASLGAASRASLALLCLAAPR